MYLLDTCALIWLVSDQKFLSDKATRIIQKNAGNLFVSSISAFEIAIKTVKGKMELPLEPGEWFAEALKHHQIEEIAITSSIAIQSALLPPIHNDPCDRIIMATAQEKNMSIITKDNVFLSYPNIYIVW